MNEQSELMNQTERIYREFYGRILDVQAAATLTLAFVNARESALNRAAHERHMRDTQDRIDAAASKL